MFCFGDITSMTYSLKAGLNVIRILSSHGDIKNQGLRITLANMRRLSTQQITKNIYLISDEKRKFDKDNFMVPVGNERPLVVLLTWLLAKQKHINKFNKIYVDQGFDVLNINIAPWQILWPAKGTQVVGNDIVRFLDTNRSYSPLLLHGFSVGGYVWGEALVKLTDEQARYQNVIDRICGQIWDSAADITEIPVGFPKAVFPYNAVMEKALRQYIQYHMKTFHRVATRHYIRASQIFHTTVVRAPALFFLSKTDPVGAYASNERVKDSWVSLGMDVTWKCWDKSPHVSHFYYHPKEYMQELYKFLDRLELIHYPERMQSKL